MSRAYERTRINHARIDDAVNPRRRHDRNKRGKTGTTEPLAKQTKNHLSSDTPELAPRSQTSRSVRKFTAAATRDVTPPTKNITRPMTRRLVLACAWAAVLAQDQTCVDDPNWVKNGDEPWKDCAWVAEFIPTRCAVRGADGRDAREACPRACEECFPFAPTAAPSSTPTYGPTTAAPSDLPRPVSTAPSTRPPILWVISGRRRASSAAARPTTTRMTFFKRAASSAR